MVAVNRTSGEQEWHPPVRGHARTWKVVWWIYTSKGEKRFVIGQREAAQAWKWFWTLRGKPHVIRGPELWRCRRRVL